MALSAKTHGEMTSRACIHGVAVGGERRVVWGEGDTGSCMWRTVGCGWGNGWGMLNHAERNRAT
eukprot:313234-Prorocentrum_lima.AAC.1